MPLMISRIVQARGRPVPFAAGRWGSITRHSSSFTSVWYRLALRLCFLRVVGVHMATPGLVSEPPGITSTPATQPLSKRPLRLASQNCLHCLAADLLALADPDRVGDGAAVHLGAVVTFKQQRDAPVLFDMARP